MPLTATPLHSIPADNISHDSFYGERISHNTENSGHPGKKTFALLDTRVCVLRRNVRFLARHQPELGFQPPQTPPPVTMTTSSSPRGKQHLTNLFQLVLSRTLRITCRRQGSPSEVHDMVKQCPPFIPLRVVKSVLRRNLPWLKSKQKNVMGPTPKRTRLLFGLPQVTRGAKRKTGISQARELELAVWTCDPGQPRPCRDFPSRWVSP